jgi:chromosome partitioning protein
MNPSLSAINQNLFLSSDAFIVPTNPDPFSVMAIETLKNILPRWAAWARTSGPLFADSAYPLPDFSPKFIGSIIQRFNIRKGRAAKPYRDNISEINPVISGQFFESMSKASLDLRKNEYPQSVVDKQYCLDEIPDFQSLLPKAYDAGVPVFELTDAEIGGPILQQMITKRDMFFGQFSALSSNLVKILGNV